MDHRAIYLQQYRQDNRAYFNAKAREQAERDKVRYGKQARCSTRRWFNGEPLKGVTIENRAITISFD
jgi:hypothetical protein